MKIGDYVGWANTWSDEEGCKPVGIILDAEVCDADEDGHTQYLILNHHNGLASWEYESDLVVMFESR